MCICVSYVSHMSQLFLKNSYLGSGPVSEKRVFVADSTVSTHTPTGPERREGGGPVGWTQQTVPCEGQRPTDVWCLGKTPVIIRTVMLAHIDMLDVYSIIMAIL